MNDLLKVVDQYMKDNYSREIDIFSDEQKAKIERERLQRIEIQQRINQKRRDAESRRETDEWNPEEVTHGEVGAHAWALFTYLTRYENLEPKEPGDAERIEFIDSELDRLGELQSQYEVEGRDLTDIDADISALEEEKEFPEDESVFTEAEDYALGEIISKLAEESESNNHQIEKKNDTDFEWF
jgi:hypothetical protein